MNLYNRGILLLSYRFVVTHNRLVAYYIRIKHDTVCTQDVVIMCIDTQYLLGNASRGGTQLTITRATNELTFDLGSISSQALVVVAVGPKITGCVYLVRSRDLLNISVRKYRNTTNVPTFTCSVLQRIGKEGGG